MIKCNYLKNKKKYEGVFHKRGSSGGGFSFYIPDNLTYNCLDEFSSINPEMECNGIKIRYSNTYKIILNVYKPPGVNSNIYLKKLERISIQYGSSYPDYALYVLSDFNIDLFKLTKSLLTRNFTNLIPCSSLCSVIRWPTYDSSTSHTLIDLICTSDTSFNHSTITPNYVAPLCLTSKATAIPVVRHCDIRQECNIK